MSLFLFVKNVLLTKFNLFSRPFTGEKLGKAKGTGKACPFNKLIFRLIR